MLPMNLATKVLDEEESFIDTTFAMAKSGGAEIGWENFMSSCYVVELETGPAARSGTALVPHPTTLLRLDTVERRILFRWEFYPKNFLGFVQLVCLLVSSN